MTVTDMWHFIAVTCNIILNPNSKFQNKKETKKRKKNKIKLSLLFTILTPSIYKIDTL